MRYHPSSDEEEHIKANWVEVGLGLKDYQMTAIINPYAMDDQPIVTSITMVIPPDVEEWLDRNLQGRWCVLSGTTNIANRIWCELQEDSVLVTLSRD